MHKWSDEDNAIFKNMYENDIPIPTIMEKFGITKFACEGHARVCGLTRSNKKHDNFIGKRFGRLVVLKKADGYEDTAFSHSMFICQCDCGKIKIVSYSNLVCGHVMSCGCLAKELTIARSKKCNTYDLSGEYGIGYTGNTDSNGRIIFILI